MGKACAKDKKLLAVCVSAELFDELRKYILAASGLASLKGALSAVVEEALRQYLASPPREAPPPRPQRNTGVRAVWEQVVKVLEGEVAVYRGQLVPTHIFVEALKKVRGEDPRTVQKWLRRFAEAKLIELRGNVVLLADEKLPPPPPKALTSI